MDDPFLTDDKRRDAAAEPTADYIKQRISIFSHIADTYRAAVCKDCGQAYSGDYCPNCGTSRLPVQGALR